MADINLGDIRTDPSKRSRSLPPMNDFPMLSGGQLQMQQQPTSRPPVAGAAPMQPGAATQAMPTDFGGGMEEQQLRQIADAWRKYYGRDPNDSEARQYLGNANYESAIQQAAQAQHPFDINSIGQAWMGSGGRTNQDWTNFYNAHPELAQNGYTMHGGELWGPTAGSGWDTVVASGLGGQGASWSPFGQGGTSGSVFNDPATQQWEQLLRTLVERLNTPQPTYTDAQRELMQTQALDPLTQERDQARQRLIQQYAAKGQQAGHSGIVDQALQDLDRQFEQMRTQQQSGFAVNQINREDQLFNSNEQRALAGLNLFSQIPQYADRRLQLANSVLMPSNPASLLGLQNQVNQQGFQNNAYNQQQQQQFWNWLAQMMSQSGYFG